MSSDETSLHVRSHVSRDLLQSAGLFKTDHLVVWEYVSNGLQYVDEGSSPDVRVRLDNKNKRITIRDNGRGMAWSDLHNFFTMHGENVDRLKGKPGRGRFGTGKSAAFGIAGTLLVTTVRQARRSKVSLSRSDIERIEDESPIPVCMIEKEMETDEPNGTLIEIEDVHLRKLDQKRIIEYIERHLAHWPRHVSVWVNQHECQYTEPATVQTLTRSPEPPLSDTLGPCTLVLKVAATPLPQEQRGVSIYSTGVWHETTLAGCEGKDMAQFILGEIDVPALEEDNSPIAAFDISRSMTLNPNNEIVKAVYGFVGREVDALRRSLVEEEKKRKSTEEAKRLARQADEIAKMINEDFQEFRQRVAKVRARAKGDVDPADMPAAVKEEDELIFGGEERADIVEDSGSPGAEGDNGAGGEEPRNLGPQVTPGSADSPPQARKAGGGDKRAKAPRGGFHVDFREMGDEENRAVYERDERTILINLEHPQFTAALGTGGIEDLTFRRLAYEVAFTEYAIALALEFALRDEYMDFTDPLQDVRETINRVARRAASLYRYQDSN